MCPSPLRLSWWLFTSSQWERVGYGCKSQPPHPRSRHSILITPRPCSPDIIPASLQPQPGSAPHRFLPYGPWQVFHTNNSTCLLQSGVSPPAWIIMLIRVESRSYHPAHPASLRPHEWVGAIRQHRHHSVTNATSHVVNRTATLRNQRGWTHHNVNHAVTIATTTSGLTLTDWINGFV